MTDITTIYESGKAAVWLQRRDFGSLEFLGCHDVTALTLPDGALVAQRQRSGKNNFVIQSVSRQTPDFGSVTIAFYRQIAGLVRDLPCPYNLLIFYSNCGADEDPTNYDFIDVLKKTYRNGRTQANVVKAIGADNATDTNNAITVEVATQFLEYYEVKPVTATPITISAIAAHVINDVAVCDLLADCGDCGDTNGCETIWVVTDGIAASAGAEAAVYKSTDGGQTWESIGSPFTDPDENIIKVACSGSTVILLDGDSAAYAYSNDGGDSFTEVTTITQVPSDVFMLGPTRIWIVGAGGYIWYSNQMGANPTTQDAGVMTAQDLNGVSFSNSRLGYVVGAANAFGYTENGGANWTARTGPAPATVLNVVAAVPDTNALFVGNAAGNLYRSKDKGVTWETVFAANTTTSGGITSIAVEETNLITFSALNSTGAGTLYRSKDGGQTWETIASPAPSGGSQGINGLAVCQPNRMFGAGDDGLVFTLKGQDYTDSDPD